MPTRVVRRLGALAFVLPFSLALSCPVSTSDAGDNGVAGTWTAISVNNQPIGSGGYELETGVFVRDMTLAFNAPRSGIVVGKYTIVDHGSAKAPQSTPGTFVFDGDGSSGSITITAFDEQITGTLRREGKVSTLEVNDQPVVANGTEHRINVAFRR